MKLNYYLQIISIIAILLIVIASLAWSYIVRPSFETTKHQEIERQFLSFSTVMYLYGEEHGELPPGPLATTVESLAEWDKSGFAARCPTIYRDRDPWGNSFTYIIDDDRKSSILRSVGPNGVDDNGGSDDIEVAIHVGENPLGPSK